MNLPKWPKTGHWIISCKNMLRRITLPKNLTDQEIWQVIRPSLLGVLILCVLLTFYGLFDVLDNDQQILVVVLGGLGMAYTTAILLWYAKLPLKNPYVKWALVILNAGLSILSVAMLPARIMTIPGVIFVLVAAIKSLLWNRFAAYGYLALVMTGCGAILWFQVGNVQFHPAMWAIAILAFIIVEIIQSMVNTNANRLRRLQTINEFARQISYSLEQEQVLSIVGGAIQKAIEADTYFLGLKTDNEHIYFHLLYDDGQFFPATKLPLAGTLSGWVLRNQRSLFIPDLRKDVDLEGVQVILTGNNRENACWMGVPMRAGVIDGIIAVASYRPNAFDRTALELLENLAQHAALALDNANHHSEVEAKSRLDSLTEVYNHGYIVQILRGEIEKSVSSGLPLSLVMLDIDYFKQYNDSYGHQIGDEVLVSLTSAIKQHIKSTDSIGRWGGEEFTIVLPNASGPQAMQVARRLQETLRTLSLRPKNGDSLPFPTISQGIAVCPVEAAEIDRLIHLADKRLYIAKNRGRNQIEPDETHWETIGGKTKNEQ